MTEPRCVDLRTAADLCGVSLKAMRNRADRGSIPVLMRDGKRMVPLSALPAAPVRQEVPQATPPLLGDELASVVARIEELAAENGKLKALTEVAESTEKALRDELAAARARAISLELQLAEVQAANGSWFTRRKRRREAAKSEGAPEALRLPPEA
jgi:hypothetical protein